MCASFPTTDALVVLGGDGTFLRAVQAVAEVDVPLLGINLGKVGFLSKAEAGELESVLGRSSRPATSRSTTADGPRGRDPAGRAAGVADLHRAQRHRHRARLAGPGRAARRAIDDSHLATFIADGLVVASPTGSTGYSFSAGGPILDPLSRNLVVTPIAAYLSAIRSVVVSPHQTVRCRVVDALRGARLDRRPRGPPVEVGDVVEVRALERPIRLIEPPAALPFWDLLRTKVAAAAVVTGNGRAGRLLELAVDDLALIDRLRLTLAAGPQRAHRRDRAPARAC